MPTFFGNPSFAELDELIAAKDATIVAITQDSAKTLVAWGARDAAAANAWSAQWEALRDRYNAARALRVHAPPQSLALPPEVIWGRVMQSIRQAWDPAGSLTQSPPESPGDLQVLARDLAAQGGKPDFSQVPQPVATDAQAVLFKAADVITRGLPSFGGGIVLALLLWLFGKARGR